MCKIFVSHLQQGLQRFLLILHGLWDCLYPSSIFQQTFHPYGIIPIAVHGHLDMSKTKRPRYTELFILSLTFLILISNSFSETSFVAVRLWSQLTSFFSYQKFDVPVIPNIFYSLSKKESLINLKKSISNLTYLFFSCILRKRFWHFSAFILSGRNGRSLCILRITDINLKYIFIVTVIRIVLYGFLSEYRLLYFPLKPFTGTIYNIAHPYRLLTSQCTRYDSSVFVS